MMNATIAIKKIIEAGIVNSFDSREKTSNSNPKQTKNQKSSYLNIEINKAMKHSNNFYPESFILGYIASTPVVKKNIEI